MFSIPAALLSEATMIDYAFQVFLTALTGACAGQTTAVLPNLYGFHSVATAQTDPISSPYMEAVVIASGAIGLQPDVDTSSLAALTAACAEYFTGTTPCDAYSGASLPTVPPADLADPAPVPFTVDGTAPEPGSATVADAYGDNICSLTAPNNTDTHYNVIPTPTVGQTGMHLSTAQWFDPIVDSNQAIGLEGRAATNWMSGASGDWTVSSGFRMTPTGPSDLDVDIKLSVLAKGQRVAFGGGDTADAVTTAIGKAYYGTYVGSGKYADSTKAEAFAFDVPDGAHNNFFFGGIGGAADPDRDEYFNDFVYWNNFALTMGTGYHWMVDFASHFDARAGRGGAVAGVDWRDPNVLLPGQNLGWRFYIYRIQIIAPTNVHWGYPCA